MPWLTMAARRNGLIRSRSEKGVCSALPALPGLTPSGLDLASANARGGGEKRVTVGWDHAAADAPPRLR